MWIRVGSFQVKPGQQIALREKYNGQAVPKVRACPGNVACLLLEPVDSAGDCVVITIWDSRESGEAYEASGESGEVVSLVREFFAGPPKLQSYYSTGTAGLLGGICQ